MMNVGECVSHRLGTDLNIGSTPYTMSSDYFNDDCPRKQIKAIPTLELKLLKNGFEAGTKLIFVNHCWWSTMKKSVFNLKRFLDEFL